MSTIDGLKGILEEQFGPERAAALDDDAAPWHAAIGAKVLDVIDFRMFVEEQFGVCIPDRCDAESLATIAGFIDAATPNPDPH